LSIGGFLTVLFKGTVKVADLNVGFANDLPIQFGLDLDDSMGGRVCGPDVQEHRFGRQLFSLGDDAFLLLA
jgi:hypothetical protein